MGYVMQQCRDNEAEAEEVPRAAGGCQGGRVRETWKVLQGGLLMMQLHGYDLIAALKNDENNRKVSLSQAFAQPTPHQLPLKFLEKLKMTQDVLVHLHSVSQPVAFFRVKGTTAVLPAVFLYLPWQNQPVLAFGAVDEWQFELVGVQPTRGTFLPQVECHFIQGAFAGTAPQGFEFLAVED